MELEADPRQAVALYLKDKLSGTQLLRCLAAYPHWRVPARLEGLVPVFGNYDLGTGERNFLMFSDPQAYMACKERLGGEVLGEYFIDRVSGVKALSALGEEIAVVNINPFSPEEIHYSQEQIPRLRAWAQIVKVEHALETMGTKRPDFATIKAFAEYFFIMEETQYIALAPDGRGRKLAALFTAEDALENFLERNASRTGLKPVPINGEKLFSAIRRMPLEGLVFNCSGPAKPRAFPLAFCDEVLERG